MLSSYAGMNAQLSLQIIYTGGSDVPSANMGPSRTTTGEPSPSTSSASTGSTTTSSSSSSEEEEEIEVTTVMTIPAAETNGDESKSDGSNTVRLSTLIVTLTPSATREEQSATDPSASDILAASTSESGDKTPLGPIIGGAVGGGVALLLALALGFFCYRRRSRKVEQMPLAHYPSGPVSVLDGWQVNCHSPGTGFAGWRVGEGAHGSPVFETEGKVICELPGSLHIGAR